MHVLWLQVLLVLGAIGWALWPGWGGATFGAFFLLLLLSVEAKQREARRALAPAVEKLSAQLGPAAFTWLLRHSLYYLTPEIAEAWSKACALVVFLTAFLMPALVVRALMLWDFGVLAGLPFAFLAFVVAVLVGGRLDAEAEVTSRGREVGRPLHEEVKRVVELRKVTGQWPPFPQG